MSEHPCCERCLRKGIAVPSEHVHHIRELTVNNYKNPMVALNPDNLEALCFQCHQLEHHTKREIGEEYYFDENGNIQPLPADE